MKLPQRFALSAKLRFLQALLSCILIAPVNGFASSSWSLIYVYEKPDGGHLMTSKRVSQSGYRLVKTYKTPKISMDTKLDKGVSSKGCNKEKIRQRREQHNRAIQVYSRVYGVDEALVHSIIKNESCYRIKAKSRVGAIGLMQLMPATAREMMISNPWNPEQNIQGGVKYIAAMLEEFKGDLRLAVAAYNAGPGNVKKYKGVPPFRETRTYVKRVLRDYQRMSQQVAGVD